MVDPKLPKFRALCAAAMVTVLLAFTGNLSSRDHPIHSFRGHTGTAATKGVVLVTGATGRTGSLLYKELQRRSIPVRALVRDAEKARKVLGCTACDETEGIFVGDVTHPPDLERATADGGVTTLAVVTGSSPQSSPEVQKAVEFDGVVNSVRALGIGASSSFQNLRIVFCSSMGTNQPPPSKFLGDILFWKLNAEAFLATSGIPTTIVKPCGLPESMPGHDATFVVGHHGTIASDYHTVSRADLASLLAEAVDVRPTDNLRFDFCSRPGPATTDLKELLERARWEWETRPNHAVEEALP